MNRFCFDSPSRTGSFLIGYHAAMIADRERVGRCIQAIDELLSEESCFCELGCGSGVFSIYAAKRCRKVYAIEVDPTAINVARQCAISAGVSSRIEFINKDVRDVVVEEAVDVLFCEMMSIWLATEPQVPILTHAVEHLLKPHTTVSPSRVTNLVELGNFDYTTTDVNLYVPVPQFTGVVAPRIMTESKVAAVIDFHKRNNMKASGSVPFVALASGRLNCARLSSIVQLSPNISFYSTDTLMPITVVPLISPVDVNVGDKLDFRYEYQYGSPLETGHFELVHV